MKYAIGFIFFFFSLSSFNSCAGNAQKPYNTAHVQDQGILKIQRFDKDFHNYLTDPTIEQYNYLQKTYPHFLKAFSVVTVNMQDDEFENKELFKQRFQSYFSNNVLSKIYDDALSVFSDLTLYENQLSDADKLIQTYLEGKTLPRLSIHVSGFKANTIVLDSLISISADKYMGKDYLGYKQFYEVYQTQQMQPDYIVRDFLKAWFMSEYPELNVRKDLLSEIIYQGKILYAIGKVLPQWDEVDIVGYTPEQLQWCNDSVKKIWKITVDRNYLFNNDFLIIQKYMDEAPHTATISTDSPGRIGAWLGLQIVKNYVKNTDTDLQSVLSENDNRKILKVAKYNP